MDDNFATLEELEARLDFKLDDETAPIAQAALDDLSLDARFYGAAWPKPGSAPPAVKSLVLRAARRFMNNPDGYTQSRAGDEMVGWREASPNAEFTEDEKARLRALGNRGKGGLTSVPIVAYPERRPRRNLPFFPLIVEDGWVPTTQPGVYMPIGPEGFGR